MRELKLNYNGHVLDDMIPGFFTANVEGRGLYTPSLSTFTVPGREGDLIKEQSLSGRDLIVHFVVKAGSAKENLDGQRTLNVLLKTEEDVPVVFTDRSEETWFGRVSDYKAPEYDAWQGTGSITIHCSTPFAYLPDITFSQGELTDTKLSTCYAIRLKRATFTATSTSGVALVNKNTALRIAFKTLPNVGVIKIERDLILLGAQNVVPYLDYQVSTWKGFSIHYGDSLYLENAKEPSYTIERLLL